jgi:hypothetical protein
LSQRPETRSEASGENHSLHRCFAFISSIAPARDDAGPHRFRA